MNVYDFDKTIFYPDSSYAFFCFCLKRYPSAVLRTAPQIIGYSLLYAFGAIRTKLLKEKLFSFLSFLSEPDEAVKAFWQENYAGVGNWYLAQKKDDDLIISASPEFLVGAAAEKLGVHLIGTRMDIRSGKISGENCHDEEKVRRFYEVYPGGEIDAFYSDSLSDMPLASIAKNAFLVKKGKLFVWPK